MIVREIEEQVKDTERLLGIEVRNVGDKRRVMRMDIGQMHVVTWEIEAGDLSSQERAILDLTRKSYDVMWGGSTFQLKEAYRQMDLGEGPFKTYQYITTIDQEGEDTKFITKRRVSPNPGKIAKGQVSCSLETLIPDDIGFWTVRNTVSSQEFSLWEALRLYFKDQGMYNGFGDPRLRIAANHLTATYPLELATRGEMQKEKTAIGFSAIELLLADHPGDTFIACQLCPEFQDQVLTVKDINGQIVKLDFPKVSQTLGLSGEWVVEMDNGNPGVIAHKLNLPGYWINNEGAAKILENLCMARKITLDDLKPFYEDLLAKVDDEEKQNRLRKDLIRGGLLDPNQQQFLLSESFLEKDEEFLKKVIRFATCSRYFKHLVPVYMQDSIVNDRLSAQELRDCLVYEAGDGPFPSLLSPKPWRLSNLELLKAAKIKYSR